MKYIAVVLLSFFLFSTNIDLVDRQTTTEMSLYEAKQLITYAAKVTNSESIIKKWKFVLLSNQIEVKIEKGRSLIANGLTDAKNKVVYLTINGRCYWDNAIIHELGHVIKIDAGLDGDRNHENVEYWNEIDKMTDEMIRNFCSDNYIGANNKPKYLKEWLKRRKD